MKIWRNDKRVIKAPKYVYCQDCALVGEEFDHCFECLASRYGIYNSRQTCGTGYQYENKV